MPSLRDIMTRDVVGIPADASLRDAIATLAGRHISGAPVVAGGKVVGVISATDILRFASSLPGVPTERPVQEEPGAWEPEPDWEAGDEPAATYFTEMWSDAGAETDERFSHPESPEWEPLEEYTVSEVMTRAVYNLPPSATAAAAADYMQRRDIHRILVMEEGQLLGIVTAHDIASAVAEGRATERRPVFRKDADFDERGW